MAKDVVPFEYQYLLHEIKERIRSAQYEALKSVNKELINLYWDMGRMISGRQSGDTWGKGIVQQLSEDLRKEFPGIRGFSERNIWYIRKFYVTYSQIEKLQPLVAEIGWTHNIVNGAKFENNSKFAA